jgi:DNA-directed RNA polymerase sigma subunit (sigma70/sigma32)
MKLGENITRELEKKYDNCYKFDGFVWNTLFFNSKRKKIIIMRFGLDGWGIHTLEEVGKEFGVTRKKIRQIESKTIRKLREQIIKNKTIRFT